MDEIRIIKLQLNDPRVQEAFTIRKKVFVEEQHCPPELEYEHDDVSQHFLAVCNDMPCGAARWRKTENGIKLERFAVLPAFRGRGVGARLVSEVLQDIKEQKGKIYLNSQLSAVNFYVPFGFVPAGEQFEEAGIIHQQMVYGGRG